MSTEIQPDDKAFLRVMSALQPLTSSSREYVLRVADYLVRADRLTEGTVDGFLANYTAEERN